jgi:primosomal protein N' (replication factor Y)
VGIAKVIVDVRTRSLAEPFDYAIPDDLVASVSTGVPVLVPLGPRSVVGYVVSLAESSELTRLKPLEAVLGESLFDDAAWQLAQWVADQYAAPISEAVRLLLPPGGVPRVARVESGDGGTSWQLQRPAISAVADTIVERTSEDEPAIPANARLQRLVLEALRLGPVTTAELAAELGAVYSAIRALERRGLVRTASRRRWRGSRAAAPTPTRPYALTGDQSAAVDALAAAVPGEVFVLDGVTGSGKTEVYLSAIERVLARGQGAIVLVPEISLTPQTVGRFRARFGAEVAVLHSRLSAGERYDQWHLAQSGEARVVVGARSALFAPVHDLGLIVIDEEHEPSYKQGSSPRYHARDVARQLALVRGAALVLGSATPSMESRYMADTQMWTALYLPERVGDAAMPDIVVVDMAAEFSNGNRSVFSRALAEGLDAVRASGTRAVLFLNRRGFASFLLCRECGFVPQCPSCSVSLTYHDRADRLTCHHCGHEEPVVRACPRCGSPYLRKFGAGTERIEQELLARWPDLPVVRMDADTTRGKGGHERALAAFESVRPAVLLGTQMIAKGLDYPDITLVGVLSADLSLRVPDFRAAERTYQLLQQVAGRAGRSEKRGTVVIQTYWPDHPAIQAVADAMPSQVYDRERDERSELGYPPYARLANVLLAGPQYPAVRSAADALAGGLRARLPVGWTVLGPADPALARLKGSHRRHMLLRGPRGAELGPLIRSALAHTNIPDGVSVAIDVDPIDLT